MSSRSLPGGQARLRSLAITLAGLLCGSVTPALAAGATFELAQVVDLLKREIAAADAPADGKLPVHIDEAQLDLDLVEVPGKAGARLVVPGSDFATGQEDPPKPALKRRIVIDFTPAKDTKPAEPLEPVANPRGGAVGTLARAINEVEAALRTGVETPPPYELKRAGIDLEFALERNAKGAPTIIVFAANRRIEPKNVQKLRLKLSARDK